MLHVVAPLARRRLLVAAGVGGVGPREPSDVAVQRRGEEHRLAVTRHSGDDAVDRGLEAHVEHPVRLVEDQHAHVAQLHRSALDQILEPAGSRDDDVSAANPLDLGLDAGAAVDGSDGQGTGMRERDHLLDDLGDQLPGRREHQRARARAIGLEHLGQRDREGKRLARSRGRLREDVAALEEVRHDQALDGEGFCDAACGERFRYWA